ncbi:MAG TPA: hypothetical protein VKQ28_18170 [Candidatus Acidoferrum sp.]|nr:hypothetical protein [Candidatus Acidoferrum sp.]
MKRIFVTITLAATAAWILAIPAAGQGRSQGHPGGGSAAAGSMGASGTHGNSASAGGSHSSSNPMTSTDPGSVLGHNSNLATRLEGLTGATGVTDLETDAKAFKNFGQFVAAAHVAKNLNIAGGFAALMCDMTATGATVGGKAATCSNTTQMSLGKAIQTLDPNANAKSESKKAINQANQDVKDSSGS